jgi:DNA processing protein
VNSDERRPLVIARAALSRIFEPSDQAGMALVQAVGPREALAVATGTRRADAGLERAVAALLSEAGPAAGWQGLGAAVARWLPRRSAIAPERDLEVIRRLGGGVLIPEDGDWPPALQDLGLAEPLLLWVRSASRTIPPRQRCVSLVGSRDSTDYGTAVTAAIAHGLVERGMTVISGGAYGIDASAHRAALNADGAAVPTIAVMAGGLDRFYPAGNEDLLRAVADRGALLAEVPPGSSPTRYRFLQRNRLIAALSAATVVVEARWRSGALNTAHHADMLSRPVGAVPGSVYSANSAGCHRLLREGAAVCVTDANEVAELAGVAGEQLVLEQSGDRAAHDGLSIDDMLLFDALPVVAMAPPEKLTSVAGLSLKSVLAGLGRLELMGLAERSGDRWRRGKGQR